MTPFPRFRFFCQGYASLVAAHSALDRGDKKAALHAFAKSHAALKGATSVADIQNRARAKKTALGLLDELWTPALRGGSL